jgi:hypothetical protein
LLGQFAESRGRPFVIKIYNGPELVAQRVQAWPEKRKIDTKFIDPVSKGPNGRNESFNGVCRDGCLNRWTFLSVREARLVVENWHREYNEEPLYGRSVSSRPLRMQRAWGGRSGKRRDVHAKIPTSRQDRNLGLASVVTVLFYDLPSSSVTERVDV